MYKPVPFFMSSRGYGMFVHGSAPATFDMGASYHGSNALLGDDELDLFVFLGPPKEVLDAYTTLTGKAPGPPLWSFGLWMSRISYFSEDDVRAVAARLRANRIPSDVIHLDTGWFETDWRCDYEFSKRPSSTSAWRPRCAAASASASPASRSGATTSAASGGTRRRSCTGAGPPSAC
jgi:alpha-D-xyloside xylohydrolase